MKWIFLFLLLATSILSFSQQNASVSFEKCISLNNCGQPIISPDGKTIVYSVTSADWTNNTFDTELWMLREGQQPIQLTRTNIGSSFDARITPDNRFVSFIANRGDKNHLYIIPVNGGEALELIIEKMVTYEWSPDGRQIAFTKPDLDAKETKVREHYGSFSIEGENVKNNQLWLVDFNVDSTKPVARQLTQGAFTIEKFAWSPDGKTIVFNKQLNQRISSYVTSDIAQVNVATKEMQVLVSNPAADLFSCWNADGSAFVYQSTVTDSVSFFYKNTWLFVYNMKNKESREIATDIDEVKYARLWNKDGIFISAFDKTKRRVYVTDPVSGRSKAMSVPLDVVNEIASSKNTSKYAVAGRSFDGLNEVYLYEQNKLVAITHSSDQIKNWNVPANEVIRWKSTDSTEIEGLLLKPKHFDPAKKYPLLVVLHGGPTETDVPEPAQYYVYPVLQWVEKGAIVLRVNYRGSGGYGEKFRSLNVRNLGVGDMWDVVSGVNYLIKQGVVDSSKMGCMGWSQGGYISAFLTTNTSMFKAISVGAGASNWITYYVGTDVTPFTRQYLQSTPWSDMAIYAKTSPITNINKATTPTLIQHGEFDNRVPIPNAYELYRGLQDRGIPSRLIVYKGFGHIIYKPKERLAAVWHNWQWFNHYVFGEREEEMPLQ